MRGRRESPVFIDGAFGETRNEFEVSLHFLATSVVATAAGAARMPNAMRIQLFIYTIEQNSIIVAGQWQYVMPHKQCEKNISNISEIKRLDNLLFLVGKN